MSDLAGMVHLCPGSCRRPVEGGCRECGRLGLELRKDGGVRLHRLIPDPVSRSAGVDVGRGAVLWRTASGRTIFAVPDEEPGDS